MSVGNATQVIEFERTDLTLVLGLNMDLGGDGSRNGTGKTTIINALSYALYGQALTNIKKNNLINKTNAKGMYVTVDFCVNNVDYRIERGRGPNLLKFFIDNTEQEVAQDTAQGDSRETQAYIERILGMSHDMFKHIMALNTYNEPFLSLRANDQRQIIEQLLGITLLSEKADRIKELNKLVKDQITQETLKITAVQEANVRIEDQIKSLKNRQKLWLNKRAQDCKSIEEEVEALSHVDIEYELTQHKSLADWQEKSKQTEEANRWIDSIESDNTKQQRIIDKLGKEIELLQDHTCHACGQTVHDDKQADLISNKTSQLEEASTIIQENNTKKKEYSDVISIIGELGTAPQVFYKDAHDAFEHKNTLATLAASLENKLAEEDPYGDQVVEMEQSALQTVSYDTINELTNIQDHQDFLLKLLTDKNSFVRKKIIDQNLAFLNKRLTHYLEAVGLPHNVVFQNDLSVEITELGRDLDFDNLSRGERNRLILSMSWAFRDVWESLYYPINLLFIDELVDSGMDANGVESALSVLKKMSRTRSKSVWLVSHKDELAGRVENILTVVKENGFTSYDKDYVHQL